MKPKLTNRTIYIVCLISALILLSVAIIFFAPSKRKKAAVLNAGMEADSFVVALIDGRRHELTEYMWKNTVLISFTDSTPHSDKLMAALHSDKDRILSARKDFLWLNFKKDNSSYIVNDEFLTTGGLKTRVSVSDIPATYDLRTMPVLFLMNKSGVIKMIYRGYSPTVAQDLISALNTK